jgi:hypothetical protein
MWRKGFLTSSQPASSDQEEKEGSALSRRYYCDCTVETDERTEVNSRLTISARNKGEKTPSPRKL